MRVALGLRIVLAKHPADGRAHFGQSTLFAVGVRRAITNTLVLWANASSSSSSPRPGLTLPNWEVVRRSSRRVERQHVPRERRCRGSEAEAGRSGYHTRILHLDAFEPHGL